jgi:hypothetical protein
MKRSKLKMHDSVSASNLNVAKVKTIRRCKKLNPHSQGGGNITFWHLPEDNPRVLSSYVAARTILGNAEIFR